MALLSEYGFSEGSGASTADNTGNGYVLTANGTAWTVAGKNGGGAVPSFSGAIGPNSSLTNWTVMCWVKRTGDITTGWAQILADPAGTFWLEITQTTNVIDYTSTVGATHSVVGPALTADTWYHVAVTGQSGVGTKLFVNGSQVDSVASVSAWNFGSGAWTVATGPDGALPGVVDELRVYDTALDAAAITTAMNTAVTPGSQNAAISAPAASVVAGATAPVVVGTEPQPIEVVAPAANVTLGAATPVVSAAGAFAYISGVHASGRYFVDQNGSPVLVRGDSPWSMFTDLSTAQVETWAANRETNGFNAAIISLVGATANGAPSDNGATYDGVLPFVGGDITNPNATYWNRIDTMMSSLRDHGITAFLYPMDGWNISSGCVFSGKSQANCQTYGAFVANRYASYPNIVWMVGGDYFPITNEPELGASTDHQFNALLAGIRSTGDTRLFSIQLGYDKSISSDNPYWDPKINFNFVYTYYPTYKAVLEAYARDANYPALFSEGNYENENNNTPSHSTTDETLRRQACWALTSGSPGDFFGSSDWKFQSGWETRLNTNAVADIKRIRDKFASLEWWKLVPDTGSTWLTAGRGTQITNDNAIDVLASDYATAAVASDNSFAVAYVPTSRSITINTSRIANATAYWFNPDTGAVTAQSLSSGTFTSPSGDNLLFVEGQPAPDYKYITSVSSNGRYFLDQDSAPIFVKGWSPWSALSDLSSSEMDTWCQGAEAAGVNAAIMSLIGSVDNGGPYDSGATYDGVLPFNGGDITDWNESYWARMDSYLAKCRDHGITVFLYPIDGWNLSKVFSGKSLADCQTYGTMVANRFASLPNIMWMSGGDYAPVTNEPWDGATTDHQINAMLTGIRSTGDTRPFSIQLNYNRSFSTDNQYWEARVDWTFCYTYFPPYECVWDSYDRVANANEAAGERDPRPSLFCEGVYEGGGQGWNTANDEVLRMQVCWSITAGSPGEFYGSMDWHFNTAGWDTRLNTVAIQQRKKMHQWFTALPGWYLLVPDEGRTAIVSAGRGTKLSNLSDSANIDLPDNDYVTAAQTPDASLTLIYVPTNISDNNARTITLNAAMLPANYSAVWVDPTDATVTQAATINGSYEVTTPGLHYDSARDWLLLIQGDSAADSSGKVLLNGQAYPVFWHDGNAWVEKPVYYHNGTDWVLGE